MHCFGYMCIKGNLFVESCSSIFSVLVFTEQTVVIVALLLSLFESTVPLWWMLSLLCCCSSASLILSSNSTSWYLTAQRCHTGGVRPGTKKTLSCGKQHRTIFSQDGYPVKPCPPVAVRLATHIEARLWYVRWSLFSITLLTLVAWARHATAVMVNMRRWGIVDLRLPPPPEAQLKNYPHPPTGVTPAPPHHSNQTDTQSGRLYKQMFPGRNSWPLTLRSNTSVHVLCAQVHMCSCAHCYAVFLLCSMYIFGLKNTLGIVEIVFFLTSYCSTVPPTFPLSRRCYKSATNMLAPHLWQVYSLLTASCGIWSTLRSLHHYPSFSLSHAPVSLPPELSVGISSPSTHPRVYAPAVLPRKFIN